MIITLDLPAHRPIFEQKHPAPCKLQLLTKRQAPEEVMFFQKYIAC